jgi:hypothetical protein
VVVKGRFIALPMLFVIAGINTTATYAIERVV